MEYKDRKIGEKFKFKKQTFEVVEGKYCIDCFFYDKHCYQTQYKPLGLCSSSKRKDKKTVIFKLIQ